MLKLIKYDLKNNMKTLLIMLLGYFILLGVTIISNEDGFGGLLSLYIVAAYIICFYASINLFLDYVFSEDEGLLFTLPIKGYKVLLSRIISSLIIFIVPIGIIYFSYSFAFPVFNTPSDLEIFYNRFPVELQDLPTKLTLSIILDSLIFYIVFYTQLITIFYFSIALSSSHLKNIRLGKAFCMIIGVILEVSNVIYMRNIDKVSQGFKFLNLNKVLFSINQQSGSSSTYGSYSLTSYALIDHKLYLTTLIYIIVTTLLLFFITSKLIDNKVEIY
ncbi:hypothetical protein SH2C18_46030 [Clostridium sediminicola]|uniref:hypothetical protein n=1 Tax=Clostridium sediminicola TaxID=3114879 RepID=UPI0031F23017